MQKIKHKIGMFVLSSCLLLGMSGVIAATRVPSTTPSRTSKANLAKKAAALKEIERKLLFFIQADNVTVSKGKIRDYTIELKGSDIKKVVLLTSQPLAVSKHFTDSSIKHFFKGLKVVKFVTKYDYTGPAIKSAGLICNAHMCVIVQTTT